MSHRPERAASLIREELSKIILREVEFPLECLATIVDAEVDPKLERAVIKVSVIPSEKSAAVFKILERNKSHLQYLLLKKINLKPMPRIEFKIDRSLEEDAKIEKILLQDKMKE